jgi:cytoskeletal protein RodZ
VATILDTYMTLIKKKISEVESIVNKADNRKTAGKIYLPKDWIGKKVKTILLSSLVVLVLVTLVTSQAIVVAKKEQPKQAVDTPSASPTKSDDSNDQPATPPTDDGSKDKTNPEGKKPHITCPPGFKVKHGVCNKDIFINVHKHSSSSKTTDATYITGTLVDCNVVFATPNYFSTLAINACNKQYGAR